MRGKVVGDLGSPQPARITPAYAGKRYFRAVCVPRFWDHPRVCGEKLSVFCCVSLPTGSPPRMRGKAMPTTSGGNWHRITPAYAGKSDRSRAYWRAPKDHPRVCGEKGFPPLPCTGSLGSPPRMRGKGRCNFSVWDSRRITPAYAGKRLKKSHSTVSPVAIVPLFPSVCNRPVVSNGNPAERDAPLFLPAENTVPASPAYNLRSS